MKINSLFFLLAVTILSINLFGATDATQEQQARTSAKLQRLNLLISAEKNLYDALIGYVNLNGKYDTLTATLGADGAITDATLLAIGLPISDYYKQSPFSVKPISLTIDDKEINLNNVLTIDTTSTDDEYLVSYYRQKKLAREQGYTAFSLLGTQQSSNWKVLLPQSTKMIMSVYQNAVDVVPTSNVKFSQLSPTDTTKIWAKSSREGNLEYFYYLNAKWTSYGNTFFDSKDSSSISANCLSGIPDSTTLQNIKGINGMCALIAIDGLMQKWWWSEKDTLWVTEGTESTGGGGTFTGSASLKDVACSIFSKEGGSIAEVSPDLDYLSLSGTVEFIKFDNLTTGGYWKQNSGTPSYVIFKDIAGAIAHKSGFVTGTKGYICKSDGSTVYELQKTSFNKWAYLGYNYNKSATQFADSPQDDGGYILSWDTVSVRNDNFKKYFQKTGSGSTLHYASKYNFDGTIVNTSDISQNIKLSPLGRSSFGGGTYNTLYLSANDDCSSLNNCNGATTLMYSGDAPAVYDNMYSWYYSPLGIIDAKPYSTLALAYADTSNPKAVVVGASVYTKENDSNAVECYKNPVNNVFYTGGSQAIPSTSMISGVVNNPTVRTCENSTYLSTYYLSLSNYTQITDWTTAPSNARANGGGKYWTKKTSGTNGYWLATDNTIQMTNGSRSDLAIPLSTTMINISRNVGTEPKYTPSGVTYTANTAYKQWWYSNTGTITQNMLDRVAAGSQTFTASGTFTVPLGWQKVTICMIGGGGGGAGIVNGGEHAGGGYRGGIVNTAVTVSSGQAIGVTVGAGGLGNWNIARGQSGTASYFGSYMASGGLGGSYWALTYGHMGNGEWFSSCGGTARNGLKGNDSGYYYGGQAGFGNGGNGAVPANTLGASTVAGGVGAGGGGRGTNFFNGNNGGRGEVRISWGL